VRANNSDRREPRVIVRSWGDQPVSLYLYYIENNRVFVGSENCKQTIGLPCDQVFAFDEDRFSRLCTAFTQGDMSKLGELYANIPVDDFACNKYQDNLDSQHDQENVTYSERTASGGEQ
jgi:hypothetical protein